MQRDAKAIKAAEHYDSKFPVHVNDDTLTPEDMALGYKQMIRVAQAWRDKKSTLDMRPVFHWAAAPHSRARGDRGAVATAGAHRGQAPRLNTPAALGPKSALRCEWRSVPRRLVCGRCRSAITLARLIWASV
jgi:hypothetical protein